MRGRRGGGGGGAGGCCWPDGTVVLDGVDESNNSCCTCNMSTYSSPVEFDALDLDVPVK